VTSDGNTVTVAGAGTGPALQRRRGHLEVFSHRQRVVRSRTFFEGDTSSHAQRNSSTTNSLGNSTSNSTSNRASNSTSNSTSNSPSNLASNSTSNGDTEGGRYLHKRACCGAQHKGPLQLQAVRGRLRGHPRLCQEGGVVASGPSIARAQHPTTKSQARHTPRAYHGAVLTKRTNRKIPLGQKAGLTPLGVPAGVPGPAQRPLTPGVPRGVRGSVPRSTTHGVPGGVPGPTQDPTTSGEPDPTQRPITPSVPGGVPGPASRPSTPGFLRVPAPLVGVPLVPTSRGAGTIISNSIVNSTTNSNSTINGTLNSNSTSYRNWKDASTPRAPRMAGPAPSLAPQDPCQGTDVQKPDLGGSRRRGRESDPGPPGAVRGRSPGYTRAAPGHQGHPSLVPQSQERHSGDALWGRGLGHTKGAPGRQRHPLLVPRSRTGGTEAGTYPGEAQGTPGAHWGPSLVPRAHTGTAGAHCGEAQGTPGAHLWHSPASCPGQGRRRRRLLRRWLGPVAALGAPRAHPGYTEGAPSPCRGSARRLTPGLPLRLRWRQHMT